MKGYVVDLVTAEWTICGDEGRADLWCEYPVPAEDPRRWAFSSKEQQKHYNDLPLNFRMMDRCNQRALDGWRLVSTTPFVVNHYRAAAGEAIYLFFERDR